MNIPTTQPAAMMADVSKSFDGREILVDLDLTIAHGEFVALLGASGSGKTTLLRILAGLEVASSGEVLVPQVRTVVYQEPRLVVSMQVWRNVVIGLPRRDATREQGCRRARARWDSRPRPTAWPGTLSGGEAQRVALARALVREPQLLVLDEPFAALDALTRLRMQSLVAELCARHHPGVLLVTHDVEEAILLADRVLVLTDSRISLDRHGRSTPAPPGGRRGVRRAAGPTARRARLLPCRPTLSPLRAIRQEAGGGDQRTVASLRRVVTLLALSLS